MELFTEQTTNTKKASTIPKGDVSGSSGEFYLFGELVLFGILSLCHAGSPASGRSADILGLLLQVPLRGAMTTGVGIPAFPWGGAQQHLPSQQPHHVASAAGAGLAQHMRACAPVPASESPPPLQVGRRFGCFSSYSAHNRQATGTAGEQLSRPAAFK